MRPHGSAAASIVGRSDWARKIRQDVARVAGFSAGVLITGPTGTGKELIARTVHASGPRAGRPFLPVDCAAIQGSLFAGELFGHVKGAFTGATYSSLGCFRAADGGTLFLDEIGELEAASQSKLLRVIQEKSVVPVGSHQGIPVDVRIITATNRNLAEEVAAGRFREDLYYRLNVVSLTCLPLKDRPEDVEILAKHFLEMASEGAGMPRMCLSEGAIRKLKSHKWPGNARQLQNLMERMVVFNEGSVIEEWALSEVAEVSPPPIAIAGEIGGYQANLPPEEPCGGGLLGIVSDDEEDNAPVVCRPGLTLAELERQYITETLEAVDYNQTICARVLDIDRRRLARKIEKHGISLPLLERGRPARRKAA